MKQRACRPCEVLFTLLLDLDVKENKGVQAEIGVLLDAVVKAVGLPGVGEEDEGDGLAKVVELEAAGADGVHDGCVVDDAGGDVECAHPFP